MTEPSKYTKYVGMDVHKETIAIGVADAGRAAARYYGEIENSPEAVRRLIARLAGPTERLKFCYEAGPCGYQLYRQLRGAGQGCSVVAPSLIPRQPGQRVKTDRRDGVTLARLDRAGELTAVWVPDREQEAIRDLSRARQDMKIIDKQLRQRLSAWLLRQGWRYPGRKNWTQAHFRWLEQQRAADRVEQIVLEEYVEAVRQAQARTARLEQQLAVHLAEWSLGPTARALMALRGVDWLAAMTLLAELGDLSRFSNPRQLMSYVGLTASEHSSGPRRRQGGITKAGNAQVRRLLIECAWAYRFPARRTAPLARRAEQTSPAVQAIAWQAQLRLCQRFRHLTAQGKLSTVVVTAVARELSGFVWAIATEAQRPRPIPAAA